METQAALEPAKETKRLVKASLYFIKRVDVSEEEFHRYWSENHGPLLCSIRYFKERIVKYNQYHGNSEWKNKAASLGLPVMEFDGAAEVWAADVDTVLGVLKDPEYLEKVAPDEEKFMTKEGMKFIVGYDDLMMDKTQQETAGNICCSIW